MRGNKVEQGVVLACSFAGSKDPCTSRTVQYSTVQNRNQFRRVLKPAKRWGQEKRKGL